MNFNDKPDRRKAIREKEQLNNESGWERAEARMIVYLIAKKEQEIRRMGFPSYLLEAIENSIVKLLAKQREEIGKELQELMYKWGQSYADATSFNVVNDLEKLIQKLTNKK